MRQARRSSQARTAVGDVSWSRSLLPHSRLNEIAPDQALNALADGRVSGEQAGKHFARSERLKNVQVRHGGRDLHGDALRPLVDLVEGAGQALGIAGDARAGGISFIFARARNGQLDQRGRQRRQDHHGEHGQHAAPPVVAPAATAAKPSEQLGIPDHAPNQSDGAGQCGHHGAGQDIAILHVPEFVRQHAFNFLVVADVQNAARHRHRGVIGIAARGKGVGRIRGNEIDLGNRDVRLGGQALDNLVNARVVLARNRLGAGRGQRDLVGEEITAQVHHGGEHQGKHQPRSGRPKVPRCPAPSRSWPQVRSLF